MPTIILLETSLFLQKQISESENLVDVFQRNVLYFLTEMEEQYPLEMTSLITFSSTAQILCPFTRDFKSLKSSLYNIKLEEDVVTKIIILTTSKDVEKWKGESEENQQRPFDYVPFCADVLGSVVEFHSIMQNSLSKINEKLKFILFKYYSTYTGELMLGSLQTSFCLYPNPNESLFSNIAASQNDLPLWFPQSISVLGTIQSNIISSPPSISRFLMYPVKCENQGLLHLLFQSLTDKVALVALSKKMWFGMIHQDCFIDQNNEKKSCLLLSVFPKNCSVEWLGNLKDLSTTSKHNSFLPLNLRNGFSYSEADTYDIHPDTLKNDLTMLSEFCSDLPAKILPLFQHIEKLRKKSLLYNLTGLMENVNSVLKATHDSSENPVSYKGNDYHERQVALANLMEQIIQNQNHSNQKTIKIPEYYLNIKVTPTRVSARQAELNNAMRKNSNKMEDM